MANSYMNQFYFSKVRSKNVLFGKVAIGATGAPTLSAVNSQGIASISRTSAGLYAITLSEKWSKHLNTIVQVLDSGTQTVACTYVVSETVNSTKIVTIQCVDFAGAAVDPRNGASLLIEIQLSNSSVD